VTPIHDSNGNRITRSIAREGDGWGVTVWFGGLNGLATDVRRYVYATREQARRASISDAVGRDGRIA